MLLNESKNHENDKNQFEKHDMDILETIYSSIICIGVKSQYTKYLTIHQRLTQDLFSTEVSFMIKLIKRDFSVLRKDFIPAKWKDDIKGHEDLYIALATLYS